MRAFIITSASICALSLSACGGGKSIADALVPPTVAVMPNALSHTATGSRLGANPPSMGTTGADGSAVFVGDFATVTLRGFMRFDLSAIPAGAEILDADLRIFQGAVNDTPYIDLGELRVDHMNFGAVLNDADYDAAALAFNYGTLSINPALEVKTLDITDAVRADIVAGRSRTDVRLRFELDTDGAADADLIQLNDAEATLPGPVPQLIVTYRLP